jgi:hypothetical protein
MHKNLIMASLAIAAFAAFAVAPVASASPVLTSEGKVVPVGTSITGKNTGAITFTGGFNVACSSADLSGTVTKNSENQIKGEIPVGSASFGGTGTGGDCTSALGSVKVTVNTKLCMETKSTVVDTETITGCGASVVFTLEITGTGPCKYSTASMTDTYTTNITPASTTVSEQEAKKSEGGFFCPGSGKLDMVFDRYTTGGAGLTTS